MGARGPSRLVARLSLAGSTAALLLITGCTAGAPEPPPPTAEPVDALTATIRCIEDRGFEAVADEYGGFTSPEMSPELSEQWRAVAEECKAETGWGIEDYDDEQLATLYELEVEQYECLLELGYLPDQPPSLQAYIDSWSSTTDPPYQPFGRVIMGLQPEEQELVLETCPPPRWTFSG